MRDLDDMDDMDRDDLLEAADLRRDLDREEGRGDRLDPLRRMVAAQRRRTEADVATARERKEQM